MNNRVFNKLELLYERVGIRPKVFVVVFSQIPISEKNREQKKVLKEYITFYCIKLLCCAAILLYRRNYALILYYEKEVGIDTYTRLAESSLKPFFHKKCIQIKGLFKSMDCCLK